MLVTFQFHGETLTVDDGIAYGDGATAAVVTDADGAPYATLSVNVIPFSAQLPDGTFYLKDYSENKALAEHLVAAGLLEAANPFLYPPVTTGFVTVKAYALAEAE